MVDATHTGILYRPTLYNDKICYFIERHSPEWSMKKLDQQNLFTPSKISAIVQKILSGQNFAIPTKVKSGQHKFGNFEHLC